MFCVLCCRGEAAQVPGVREGLQSILQPDHAQPQAHGLQALRLRPVRPSLPAQGRLAAAQGDPAHGDATPPGDSESGGLHDAGQH